MSDKEYRIVYCWNGNKRQVYFTDTYDTRREWRYAIETMPYDIIDESDHICWVDYGDNDY